MMNIVLNKAGAKKPPKVFIIILNYNGKDVLLDSMDSVFRIDYPNFELIVVDNDSKDGSLEDAKRKYPKTIFIKNEANLGFAAGNNVGIKYALEKMADFVLLLNYDTKVKPDFLSRLIKISENNPQLGILSPVILKNEKGDVWFSGGKINWLSMKTIHERKTIGGDFCKTEFVTGCSILIKKEVFKKIGLLDEDFFLYWEDADFSYRAKKAGFLAAVAAKSFVYHLEKSEENSKNKLYWLVVSGLIFFQKNTPFYLKPWIFFYTALRKVKNWKDRKFKKDENSLIVQKAYKDFKYAR